MAQVADIGIDLGTSNVLFYMKGKGIVLREPAVVAVERDSRKIITYGGDAYRMIGRTPSTLLALRPLHNGTMIDFEMCRAMLQAFTMRVIGKHFFSRPRCVISVPTSVNEAEKRQIISAMFDAGVRRTQLIEKPIAAALGVGLPFMEPFGTMIVDMGAGATDIAVLSQGQVAVSSCVQIGGDYFDDAIIRYIRKKYSVLIGTKTAEELKINIGCAVPGMQDVTMDVTGRNLVSGLPQTQSITTLEVFEALQDPIAELIEAIQAVLEHTPPQLINDVFNDGIIFTGGAAALNGLCEAVYEVLKVPCGVADDPQTCVALGCGKAIEDPKLLKMLASDSHRRR